MLSESVLLLIPPITADREISASPIVRTPSLSSTVFAATPITFDKTLVNASIASTAKAGVAGTSQLSTSLTGAATGNVRIAGIAASTLAGTTLASAGSAGEIEATLDSVLAAATGVSEAAIGVQGNLASLVSLQPLVSDATHPVVGSLTRTAASASVLSSGNLGIAGTTNVTLAEAALVASGQPSPLSLTAMLAPVAISSAAAIPVAGSTTRTLAPIGIDGRAAAAVASDATSQLADVAVSSTAQTGILASSAGTLDAVSLLATGGFAQFGTLIRTLADLANVASGVLPVASETVRTLASLGLQAADQRVLVAGSVSRTFVGASLVPALGQAHVAGDATLLAENASVASAAVASNNAQVGKQLAPLARTIVANATTGAALSRTLVPDAVSAVATTEIVGVFSEVVDLSAVAAATVNHAAVSSVTLADLAVVSQAETFQVIGVFATLESISTAIVGSLAVGSTVAKNLEPAAVVSTADVPFLDRSATLSTTLDAVAGENTAQVGIAASVAITTADVIWYSSWVIPIAASSAAIAGPASLQSGGSVEIVGATDASLGVLSLETEAGAELFASVAASLEDALAVPGFVNGDAVLEIAPAQITSVGTSAVSAASQGQLVAVACASSGRLGRISGTTGVIQFSVIEAAIANAFDVLGREAMLVRKSSPDEITIYVVPDHEASRTTGLRYPASGSSTSPRGNRGTRMALGSSGMQPFAPELIVFARQADFGSTPPETGDGIVIGTKHWRILGAKQDHASSSVWRIDLARAA